MPLRELTTEQTKEIENIMVDFVTAVLDRKEKIDDRYTGSELTNNIYNKYLKSLSPEDQTLFFENILLYLSTFKKHELINLLKGTQKASAPWLMADYKNSILPDFLIRLTRTIFKLSTFTDKDELADFIHAQGVSSLMVFLDNTPAYRASTTSISEATEESFEEDDFDAAKITAEAEIIKHNQIAMQNYKDIIRNLLRYCNILRVKINEDKIGNNKENIITIEQIQRNCMGVLTIIDTEDSFVIEKLPLDIPNLIKYTNFIIHFELEIDTRIMQQENYIPKAKLPTIKEEKPLSLAVKIVKSLTKLLDTLLIIKENFQIYMFGRPKPSTTIHRDEEADIGRQKLMLFYDNIQPGFDSSLKEIRENVAKLRNLSKPSH